ncbi:MAG TPA: beta-galactosidase [Pseudomonadales bacterium]|nr:beta-galactosidase [Pseudomonadales bacterium]
MKRLSPLMICLFLAGLLPLSGAPLEITIQRPPPAGTGYFTFGTNKNTNGDEISVNSRSLLLNGRPWFPVMGEFHYSRVPENEWLSELLKMKAGGVDIVSTYVFWIHHEEVEGQWDWTGQRDLRKFLQTCNDAGLIAIVRCGPWSHGEVRNGGLPDWVIAHKDWKMRSTDTNFLAQVRILYSQVANQLQGELWKDGGPVIGIQLDNEFGGSPKYLLALKQIAIESGLDVPLYTKTGWPAMRTPVPLGELLPFFGTYPDGFWERKLTPMNGDAWESFAFKITRTDTGVGDDELGNRTSGDTAGTEKYPYLTCEIGGGMPASYHRRMNYDPRDVESVALCQLGSGSSLMGYYMYHGGQNPDGQLTTLQESQATGYPNDLPVKTYDFNAPLGEYGQINPQYLWLRRLHLFLHDFGSRLAQMPTTLPASQPTGKDDVDTLRWTVRSNGTNGYVFVNNYQRLQPMPAKTNVQFKLDLPGGSLVFPSHPVTVPANEFFFWPFNMNLGGARLVYATAQPVCQILSGNVRTVFFAQTPGIETEFAFDAKQWPAGSIDAVGGQLDGEKGLIVVHNVKPSRSGAIVLQYPDGDYLGIVVLSEADSLRLSKAQFGGNDFAFLSDAGLVVYGDAMKLSGDNPKDLEVEAFPKSTLFSGKADGIFHGINLPKIKPVSYKVKYELLQPAGPPREIPINAKTHLAVAPVDTDFTNAAIWKIKLPRNLDMNLNPILRIHYVGDVARLTLNGKLLDDNFYSGRTFDLGLTRYAPEILNGDLELQILPLMKGAPVYLEPGAKPNFGRFDSMAKVNSVEIVNDYSIGINSDQ